MWRTRCVRLLGGGSTGSKHATDVSRLHFDAIVVGAGTSGCLVAGRLGMENLKTLVIEEGIDIRRRSEWHWTLPCSMLEHRLARRGYESDDTDTVPQRTFSSFSSPHHRWRRIIPVRCMRLLLYVMRKGTNNTRRAIRRSRSSRIYTTLLLLMMRRRMLRTTRPRMTLSPTHDMRPPFPPRPSHHTPTHRVR